VDEAGTPSGFGRHNTRATKMAGIIRATAAAMKSAPGAPNCRVKGYALLKTNVPSRSDTSSNTANKPNNLPEEKINVQTNISLVSFYTNKSMPSLPCSAWLTLLDNMALMEAKAKAESAPTTTSR
jgi:hypothetical protein